MLTVETGEIGGWPAAVSALGTPPACMVGIVGGSIATPRPGSGPTIRIMSSPNCSDHDSGSCSAHKSSSAV